MHEFKKVKPARNPDELLTKLQERNLTINDCDVLEIKNSIRNIGYYRLSGYFGPLQNPKDVFREGAEFKDIIRLYEFDKELRKITSQALKVIEIALKAKLTDIMSSSYESDWYVDDSLFMTEKTIKQRLPQYYCEGGELKERIVDVDIKLYNSLKNNIMEHIIRNKEMEYIKKFKNDYDENATAPSWMMMECISFGILSRLFSLLKHSEEKKIVSTHFGANTVEIFSSWLHGFAVLRNACAHHARIWNKHQLKELQFPKKKSAKFITENNNANLKKFYGISGCILQTLYKISHELGSNYKKEFYSLVDKYGIDMSVMGFPLASEEYDIWNNEVV